jgi:FkbM family methyltransferase
MPEQDAIAALLDDPAMATLHRSLAYYHGNPDHAAALEGFYGRVLGLGPGDLVFDVGAHVGDRLGSFRRLGAMVVAVEPQPLCARALRELYADDDAVTVVEAACGRTAGPVRLHVNSANPTVSTASPDFVSAADGARGWEGQSWDAKVQVRQVTLDSLARSYGVPAFVKIDVEGYEESVLDGLTSEVRALSFEFTTIAREVSRRCLARSAALGFDAYDVSLGDSFALTHGRWITAAEMEKHLDSLPHEANSGDVYALRSQVPSQLTPGAGASTVRGA